MIHMVFKLGGKVVIMPTGYGGQLCRRATEPYERALAGKSDTLPTVEADLPEAAAAPAEHKELA